MPFFSSSAPLPAPLPASLIGELTTAGWTLAAPITPRKLAKLRAATGELPEGLASYLATADGLKHADGGRICGSKEMLKPYPSSELVPLRTDGCGNYEAVVVAPGPLFGVVVFWDHETLQAEYLAASSVPVYLELLATTPQSARWSEDNQSHDDFLRLHDPGAARLLDNPALRAWVGDGGRTYELDGVKKLVPGERLPWGARKAVNPFTGELEALMPSPKHRTPPTPR